MFDFVSRGKMDWEMVLESAALVFCFEVRAAFVFPAVTAREFVRTITFELEATVPLCFS